MFENVWLPQTDQEYVFKDIHKGVNNVYISIYVYFPVYQISIDNSLIICKQQQARSNQNYPSKKDIHTVIVACF